VNTYAVLKLIARALVVVFLAMLLLGELDASLSVG
jgi:hypothetical protein